MPQLVMVEWSDSHGVTSCWERIDEVEPLAPVPCVSVGFLIDDRSEYKTLVQTIGGEQILGRITIPEGSILRIRRIADPKRRKRS